MDKGLIIHTIILNDRGQALVIRRKPDDRVLPGVWDIPGGTLEDGEDPIMGAIRETKEETNLEIKNLRLFFYTSNVDTGKNKQFVRLIFRADYSGGDIRLNPDEHVEFKWADPKSPDIVPLVEYLPATFTELLKK